MPLAREDDFSNSFIPATITNNIFGRESPCALLGGELLTVSHEIY